jgi:hypothetical protein
MPGTARGLVTEEIAAGAHHIAGEHASGITESHNVKCAAQDERELGFRLMTMGSEVGLPVGDDEKALYRVVGRGVNIVVRASTRARRSLGGELIQECRGEKFHGLPDSSIEDLNISSSGAEPDPDSSPTLQQIRRLSGMRA